MVPVHDTDVAEERWSKAQWRNFELWEKVEQRLRKKKRYWIYATLIVFVLLSSVPVFLDRWPKWQALAIGRQLAIEVNRVKMLAAIHKKSYRIRFLEEDSLSYVIESAIRCSDKTFSRLEQSSLGGPGLQKNFTLVTTEKGNQEGIPGLIRTFCYDALDGNVLAHGPTDLRGFAIAPVKDLTKNRLDRVAVLLLRGKSAEITFD